MKSQMMPMGMNNAWENQFDGDVMGDETKAEEKTAWYIWEIDATGKHSGSCF